MSQSSVKQDRPGHEQVTVICPQWTALAGTAVDEEIRKMWADYECGNDHYYLKWYEEMDEDYPATAKYIKDNNIEGEILIHWWW